VIFFVHSTGILRRIGTKHEISVRKSCENPLEKNLSIVIRFVVFIKISNYLALNFQVTIQNVMLFFIIRPVNVINLCPLLNGKIKQARDASVHHRNEAADERRHKHKKSHDKRLLNVDR
jgi:hypothetical protein